MKATIDRISRDDLRRIAMVAPAEASPQMHALLADFCCKGLYTEATEDDIERFETLLDQMLEV